MPIRQDIFDEIIDNALDVLRYIARQKSATVARLRELEKELLAEINERELSKAQKRSLEKFLKDADKIIERAYLRIFKDREYKTLAETIAEATVQALQIVFGKPALTLPTKDYFKSLESDVMVMGAPSADWWRGQERDTQFRFAQQVRQGAANGETNSQIVDRIVGNRGHVGVMQVAERNASALVHSSLQTVANDARRATFEANRNVVKGLRQVSTLDGHTSDVCIAYSGAEWNLDFKPINGNRLNYAGGVPRHFNCRSVEIPITKTFKEMGLDIPEPKGTTRASSEGQIDVNTSFADFLKRKGKAYQDQMLGIGRAELWRQGKITLSDLVNAQGRPLTLAELQAKVARRRKRQ